MVKATIELHTLIERFFAGMTERRMSKIMHKGHGLREIFIQSQSTRQRAGNLRHLDGMGQTGSIVIAFMGNENLRLMFEATKGRRVNDSVAIALERRSRCAFRLRNQPSTGQGRIAGVGRAFAITEANSFQRSNSFRGHCDAFLTVI